MNARTEIVLHETVSAPELPAPASAKTRRRPASSATFTADQIAALAAPLNARHVKERAQAGRKVSYIEGWHAVAEANRIFGFDGWTRETVDIRQVAEHARSIGTDRREGFGVSYAARVRVTVGSIVREGVGAGHGIDADLGLAHESALKEAETDAMKRALMTFGNQFGLALYGRTQGQVTGAQPAGDELVTAHEAAAILAELDHVRPAARNWFMAKFGIRNAGELPRAAYGDAFGLAKTMRMKADKAKAAG